MNNEAREQRVCINQLLEEAGWRFFDSDKGLANILLESHFKIKERINKLWGVGKEEEEVNTQIAKTQQFKKGLLQKMFV